jgi:hypothetical protein
MLPIHGGTQFFGLAIFGVRTAQEAAVATNNFVFCIASQRTKRRIHRNQGIVWLTGVADDGCDGAKADGIQNWMTRGFAWLRIQIRFHFDGRCRKNINVATVPSK